MAKPFGFGSVQISAENIFLRKQGGGWNDGTQNKKAWIEEGWKQLTGWFKKEWHEVKHIEDLRKLLKFPDDIAERNVCYPELKKKNDDKIPGYVDLKKEWPEEDRLSALTTPWTTWCPPHKKENNPTQPPPALEEAPSEYCTGTVKWYNREKKYGVITPEDNGNNKDSFFLQNWVIGGVTLAQGQRVKFKTRPGQKGKGPEAYDVKPS